MNFIKNLFNDESTIIGLCGFEKNKPKCYNNNIAKTAFLNTFAIKTTFETNFAKNVFLEV